MRVAFRLRRQPETLLDSVTLDLRLSDIIIRGNETAKAKFKNLSEIDGCSYSVYKAAGLRELADELAEFLGESGVKMIDIQRIYSQLSRLADRAESDELTYIEVTPFASDM